jgi:hypothetical protein
MRTTLMAALSSCLLVGCLTQVTPIDPRSRLSPGEAPPKAHHFDHVLIIVLENQDYRDVLADPDFQRLASRGATFSDFQALFHPSYPNYLSMISGRSVPTHGDLQVNVDFRTIADSLEEHHLSWANYAERYQPAPGGGCNLHSSAEKYARRHVPFLSFSRVQKASCRGVVPADRFENDLRMGTLPNYMFYSPDLDHDGHDPVHDPHQGLAKANAWLRGFLEPLFSSAAFTKDTLTIVTFDESESHQKVNPILTVFLGDMVQPGVTPGHYNHFNVLRTIEDNFGLEPISTGDGGAAPIPGIWK